MKSTLSLVFILSLTSILGSVYAQDSAKGKELYAQCIQCHGEKGEGNLSQKGPKLSGQHDWYVVKQISEIKSGVRKNAVMVPFVSKLTEQDIKDLAAYIATL